MMGMMEMVLTVMMKYIEIFFSESKELKNFVTRKSELVDSVRVHCSWFLFCEFLPFGLIFDPLRTFSVKYFNIWGRWKF